MRKFLTLVDPVVPMHHPRLLVETASGAGVEPDAMLARTGITPAMLNNPDARISYAQFGRLIGRALKLTGNPALGLDFGKRIHLCHMGMLGVAVMSCSRAGEALDMGLRYSRAVAPAWDMALEVGPQKAVVHIGEGLAFGPYQVFAIESMLAAFCSQARFLLDSPSQGVGDFSHVVEVWLPYERPAHAAEYAEVFGERIHFASERIAVAWDAALMDQPLPFADPITAQLAERNCAEQLAQLPTHEGLVPQVRRLLEAAPGECPDVEHLARRLQTSPRSLRRDLQAMGTSYQKLVDEVRQAQAVRLVTGTRMTAEQVAERLGFADVRSFRRAFKRWTGHTPKVYRDHTIAAATPV